MTKREREEIEYSTKLRSISIYCAKLKRDVMISRNNYKITSWKASCDCCGTHGEIAVEIKKCKCGLTHKIEVEGW